MVSDLLLPTGTRLIHIGPPKTATTALQESFDDAAEDIGAQGVHYPGMRAAEIKAMKWLCDPGRHGKEAQAAGERAWRRIVRAVRQGDAPRTFLSNEFYTRADSAGVQRILEDLGSDDVHVALTLRPLVSILPSQWQQFLKQGYRVPYEDWLRDVLDKPDSANAREFWMRQRHDELVTRWAAQAGADHVTVVVLDPADREMLPRTFEQLLGLREHTLDPHERSENRSLTRAESDLLLAFNQQVQHRITHRRYIALMRGGPRDHFLARRPEPHEAKIETPSWARDRVLELGRQMGASIAESGVRIIGDLSAYVDPAPPRARADDGGALTPEVAARLADGLARAKARRGDRRVETALDDASWRQLTAALRTRVRRRLSRR